MTSPTDAELVAAAQLGDAAALGALLQRHRAGMHAVVLGVLGWTPETEDVVQDAMLSALTGIGQVREPAAAGAWLRAIARNGARMRVRSRAAPEAPVPDTLADRGPTPEELLDRQALRDWVWTALRGLSEPLQTVVLLRWFTGVTSYEQIAALCQVPVGTVRSRLNEARRKLTDGLRSAADAVLDDAGALTARRLEEAEFLLASAPRGEFRAALGEVARPDLVLIGPQGQRGVGRDLLVTIMESDLAAGVRQRLAGLAAGSRVTVWECELLSPPEDPEHCPPGAVWLLGSRDGRITRIRLFHPANAQGRTGSP